VRPKEQPPAVAGLAAQKAFPCGSAEQASIPAFKELRGARRATIAGRSVVLQSVGARPPWRRRSSIHGGLGADPAERTTQAGKPMTTASLAVHVARQGGSEDTEWLSVVSVSVTKKTLARHQKGDVIAVMGQLCRSRYAGRDGQERISWSLTAENLVSARTVRLGSRPATSSWRPNGPRRSSRPDGELPNDSLADLWNKP